MHKSISSPTYSALLDWLKTTIALGLTNRELAHLLDEHPSVMGKIKTGQLRLNVYEYVQYCAALQIPPRDGLQVLTLRKAQISPTKALFRPK